MKYNIKSETIYYAKDIFNHSDIAFKVGYAKVCIDCNQLTRTHFMNGSRCLKCHSKLLNKWRKDGE